MKKLFKLNVLLLLKNKYFWICISCITIILLCMCLTSIDDGISKVGLFNVIVLITCCIQFIHMNKMIRSGLREKEIIYFGGKKVKIIEFIFLTFVVIFLTLTLFGGAFIFREMLGLNGYDMIYILLSVLYVSIICYATADVYKVYGIGNIIAVFILMNLSMLAFLDEHEVLNLIFPIRWWIQSKVNDDLSGCIKLLIYDLVMLVITFPIGLKRLKALYK